MPDHRVVEGRMVDAVTLAERIEGGSVMDATAITDSDRSCPSCGGNVLEVGYMPSVTAFVTGWKCQDCAWAETDRE